MSARKPPRPGWVTVADAAAALTKAGDPIDPSNVSRYLARNDDVPSQRHGKFRWVDLQALQRHRSGSIFVAEKRDSRGVEPATAVRTAPLPMLTAWDDEEDDEGGVAGSGSAAEELRQTNLAIKQVELRRRQREEAVEEGRLVPAEDLQAVLTAFVEAIKGELAREEMALQTRLGREVASEVRRAHRQALGAASRRLAAAAKEHLKPGAAIDLAEDAATSPAAA
jgi:hypothetical protein